MTNRDTRAARRAFARNLQAAMRDRGMNQADLAAKARLAAPGTRFERDTISTYIRAVALPSPKRLKVISEVLGVKPDALLPDEYTPDALREDRTPARNLQDEGDGNAFLEIRQSVPFDTALKILELLKK